MNQSVIVKNILITGGTGFVGWHLVRFLRSALPQARITIIDNFFRGKRDSDLETVLKDHFVKCIEADLTHINSLEQLTGKFEYVFHLAAINGTRFFYEMPHEVLRVNILSLINVLDWFCKQNYGKLVFSSSGETYAGSVALGIAKVPTPENIPLTVIDPHNPRWSYGGSKIIGELLCLNYARIYKRPITVVRFHNFYGPRMGFEHVIPEFCKRLFDGNDPFIIKGGKETRAFCFIEDGIRGLYLAMKTDAANNEIINLGNDTEEITIVDMAQFLFKIVGKKPRIQFEDAPSGSVPRRCPDLHKARMILQYEPRVVLTEGLAKTWDWYNRYFSALHV